MGIGLVTVAELYEWIDRYESGYDSSEQAKCRSSRLREVGNGIEYAIADTAGCRVWICVCCLEMLAECLEGIQSGLMQGIGGLSWGRGYWIIY